MTNKERCANEAEQLREEILEKTKQYYALVHQDKKDRPFIADTSRIDCAGRVFDDHEITNLVDSSLEFWLTYGRYSRKFEVKLAKFLGVRYALLVNSGSSANLLAFFTLTSPLLKERQVKPGDEVISVAAGFPTTVAPIVQYGAVPVFLDVEIGNYNIQVDQLESALSPKTKAIMIAHTLGNPFDLKTIKAFCEKHNLWLIEDNCDALGSNYAGKFTGTWGDIGTSSFYPAHHITMGEGGAVYTNNHLLKKIALSMAHWGRDCWCDSGKDNTCGKRFDQSLGELPYGYDHKYTYSHFGFNLKVTDMQAAIGLAQLEKLPEFGKQRRENFSYLYDLLSSYSDYFILPDALPEADPSWFGFLLTLRENLAFSRNELTQYLEKANIQTRNLFAGNLTRHPCFSSLELDKDYRIIGDLKNTDKIMNQCFWVGIYPGLEKKALDYIAGKIGEFIALKQVKE